MSNQNTHHGLADLGLGAPIGGGSTTSHSTNTYNTSSTSAGAPVSGLTGGHHHHEHDASHQHSHDPSHVHDANCGHDSSYNASGATRNTTSGDQGIGRGHGGTTAFESDPSRVGEGRSSTGEHRSVTDKLTGREHGQHGVSGSGAATAAGLTGAGHDLTHQHHHTTSGSGVGADLRDKEAGIKAGLGAGHHDQSSSGLTSGSGLTGSHEHHQHGSSGLTSGSGLTGSRDHHHSGAAAGVGAAAAAAGAAGVGLTGRQATHIDRDGVIADSVTGQTHFVEGQSTSGVTSGVGHSTSGVGHSSTGLGAGAGAVGAGATGAGLASHGQHGQGLTGQQQGLSSHSGERSEGPLSGLKQELKEHQCKSSPLASLFCVSSS
ncbi:hypothetical protein NCC49_003636 [Naganishia albida]|nr:hypothetical protein NCC49_003636 [Naganishia albida]